MIGCPISVDGRLAFEVLGYAALPDGTLIPASIAFAGRPIAGSEKILEVQGGYFAMSFGPIAADKVLLQGLYTAQTEFVLSRILEKGAQLPKGLHLPEELVKRYSFLHGSTEGEQAEAQQVASLFRSVLEKFNTIEAGALSAGRGIKGKPSDDGLRGWNESYGDWEQELASIEAWRVEHEARFVAPRFPDITNALSVCLLAERRFLRVLTGEVYRACGKSSPFQDEVPGQFSSSIESAEVLERTLKAYALQVEQAEGYKAGSIAAAAAISWVNDARALAREAAETLARTEKGEAHAAGGSFGAEGFLGWAFDWDARADGLSDRDPGLASIALAGGADFASGLRRLRESFRAEAKRLLRAKRTEAPVPFRDAEGPALAPTAEGLEREWAELAARLTR